MTPSEILTDARYILNDTDATSPRQSDTELLEYVNDGLKEVLILRPELFSTIGDLVCTQGTVEQQITFVDAVALVEVLCIHNGAALTPFDMRAMDAFSPTWRAATPAAASQWTKKEGDPLRFFLNVPAPASQTVDVRYIRNPSEYALGAEISDLPDAYKPALVDYVVHRAEAKDDEHVLSGRSEQFYQSFVSKIKG